MSNSYYNALATTSYRPYLQPTPGLGSYNRNGLAIILGGPRAGAGSGSRIYNYLQNTNKLGPTLSKLKQLIKAKQWQLSNTYRNYVMSFY
jgi:hypothetical protein